ncbi:MAG: grasp-with-spasm system SPASM domain peptide maturase [Bacteroidia bacterium]
MNNDQYFLHFANCIPVKGHTKGVLVDLQHGRMLPIPLLLLEVLEKCKKHTIAEVKASFNHELDEGIDSYLGMLQENLWGFVTEDPHLFPALSLDWDHPCLISNVVLDVGDFDVQAAFDKIVHLAPQALLIRAYKSVDVGELAQWLKTLDNSRIFSLQLMLPWEGEEHAQALVKLVYEHPRLNSIVLHSAPETKYLDGRDEFTEGIALLTEDRLHPQSPEQYQLENLLVDIAAFTEAQEHNLGLNRKLSIDSQGFIKNHVLHKQSFGHIDEVEDLSKIVASPAFQRIWNISHDQVETCKDCEFRYCCVDFDELEEKDGNMHRIGACGYDPYSGHWHSQPERSLTT